MTLAQVQARACASMDAFPEYWCDDPNDGEEVQGRKEEVRRMRSIADIHSILGLDCFGY